MVLWIEPQNQAEEKEVLDRIVAVKASNDGAAPTDRTLRPALIWTGLLLHLLQTWFL